MSSGSSPSCHHRYIKHINGYSYEDYEALPPGTYGDGVFLGEVGLSAASLHRRFRGPSSVVPKSRSLAKFGARRQFPSSFRDALIHAPQSSTEAVILGPAAEGNTLNRNYPASASGGAGTACPTAAKFGCPVAYPSPPSLAAKGAASPSCAGGGLIAGSASKPTVSKIKTKGGGDFLAGNEHPRAAAPKETGCLTAGSAWEPTVARGLVAGAESAVAAPKERALRTYGRDMSAAALQTDPVIGRDDEIERIICILCRRTKNSAVLVGAPGVGKTAIAEGLAQRISAGTVPATLAGACVVEVDLAAMVAGCKYRGMFEERMKKVIKEAEGAAGKTILFFDEMHMLLGSGRGGSGAMDGANMLKPALARGRIRCVGATTFDEYSKYVEKDAALERRFQKVHVEEPSVEATIAILQGLKQRYEEHHGLKIQDAALVAAAQLAGRYVTGRQFPDKAIDLIDEACATSRIQIDNQIGVNITRMQIDEQREDISIKAVKEGTVGPDHVAQVVSRWTGIPVTTLDQEEKEKLMHLADRLHERVVGQDEAVSLVAQAVLRSRSGLEKSGQPIGSFLFLGSTGVGKTELAKALAEQLFDSEKMLLRFDMSEYVCSGSVLRLIGAPPSYHGHEEGGQLTEKVRRRPYSVILFDEVEKADPAVFNLFLQLLDDGMLTDGKGRTVDFKNTIIIMTSNLGAEHLMAGMSGEQTMESARDLLMIQVQKHLKPELLNRLSEIVVFEPLSLDKLKEVVKIQVKSVVASVAEKGITLTASDAALGVILSKSYNPMYGARPVRRWMRKNVLTKLSEMLVKGEADEGSSVGVDATDDKRQLKYTVVKRKVADPLGKRPAMGLPVDPDADSSDDDVVEIPPPTKKMKKAGKA